MSEDRRTLKPGRRLNVPERVKRREEQARGPLSDFRGRLESAARRLPVEPPNENITTDTMIGAIGTFIVFTAEDYLPVRLGASVSITDSEKISENEYRYVVDVNAPLEAQARFKALMQTGTGAVSLWVDEFEIESFERIKKRPARDTYRYELKIIETSQE